MTPSTFTFALPPVQLVQLHSRAGRVQLQIKRGGLDELLLVVGQPVHAAGECVGDAEVQLPP